MIVGTGAAGHRWRTAYLGPPGGSLVTSPVTPADDEPLRLRRDGAVATLTLNRPARLNAISYAMFARLPGLLAELAGAAAAAGLRALVLRGAGQPGILGRRGHLRVPGHPGDQGADRRLRRRGGRGRGGARVLPAAHRRRGARRLLRRRLRAGHRLRRAVRGGGRPVRDHPGQAGHRLPAARHQAAGRPGRAVPRQDHPDDGGGLRRRPGAGARAGRRGVPRPRGA